MDATRTDVEACALLRHARGCKFTLFVALQNVILTACLLTALYVYWTNQEPDLQDLQDKHVHIQFLPIADILGNTTLKFEFVMKKNKMELRDESYISIECTGPYVMYMYLCYKSTQAQASGTLELQVTGSKDPQGTLKLQAHSHDEVCRGLHSVVYLREKEEATLRLYSTENFRLKKATVGFDYLLGSRCDN